MKHTESEISTLKGHHSIMWELVEQQVRKAFVAVVKNDKDLAREIISREKMVNAQELVVDSHCENFIALFAPVAIDLRFVISLLKINNNLERIGDFAESLALFVLHRQSKPLPEELIEQLNLRTMLDTALKMMELTRKAFDTQDSKLANKVLGMDDILDRINTDAVKVLADHIVAHPETTEETLHIYAVIRRIERIGDRVSNMAENIVFFVDAKEMRHKAK